MIPHKKLEAFTGGTILDGKGHHLTLIKNLAFPYH